MFKFPEGFIDSLSALEGFDKDSFVSAHEKAPPVSIRKNPYKDYLVIDSNYINIPWCDTGYYLKERPVFTLDPKFLAGGYYVQEASSMFISHILKHLLGGPVEANFLDMCAAPGGKSTILLDYLKDEGVLVSNEIIVSRCSILAQNLAKWGRCNHIVTNNNHDAFRKIREIFDLILVDAPCSGSGLFRKQPESVNEWSLQNVEMCATRQREILESAFNVLKPGGYLIYSTCSYSRKENEEITNWVNENYDLEHVEIPFSDSWGIIKSDGGYRFYLNKLEGEGFYCAVFRKKAVKNLASNLKNDSRYFKNPDKSELSQVEKYLKENHGQVILKAKEEFKLIGKGIIEVLSNLQKPIFIRTVGTNIGMIKGKDFIPSHELALSVFLSEQVDDIQLNEEQAISYYKKQDFVINPGAKGMKLVKHNSIGLGWCKLLERRMNNYLPNAFMIRNQAL